MVWAKTHRKQFSYVQAMVLGAIDDPGFSAALPPLSDNAWRRILDSPPAYRQHLHDENERLEFMGDALMYPTIARQLYRQLPNGTPYLYTCLRQVLHSNVTFARLAEKLDIFAVSQEVLQMLSARTFGEGANAPSKSWTEMKITADLFEVVICAYYLQSGFEALCDWVTELYTPIVRVAYDAYTGSMHHKAHKRPREFDSTNSAVRSRKTRRTIHYVSDNSRVFTGPGFHRDFPKAALSVNHVREALLRRASSVPSMPTPASPQPSRILIDLTNDEDDEVDKAPSDYDDVPGLSFHPKPTMLATSAAPQGNSLLVNVGNNRPPRSFTGSIHRPVREIALGSSSGKSTTAGNSYPLGNDSAVKQQNTSNLLGQVGTSDESKVVYIEID